MSEKRIDGILQPEGIPYTKEEEKELGATMANASTFERESVRAYFDLAVSEKHRDESPDRFEQWAAQYRKIHPPDLSSPTCFTQKTIREAKEKFDRTRVERKQAEEARKKAEAKTREQEKLTAELAELLKSEKLVFLTFQIGSFAVSISGKVQKFTGFKPGKSAVLLIGCDNDDRRGLFCTVDLASVGWTLYGEGKDRTLVLSPEGDAEIRISECVLTSEEYEAMFGEAEKALLNE